MVDNHLSGLAIVLLAMGFSLLADGLGDKLGERV
jgi:peptide/nickel transport system permease protein